VRQRWPVLRPARALTAADNDADGQYGTWGSPVSPAWRAAVNRVYPVLRGAGVGGADAVTGLMRPGRFQVMKKLVELLVCFIHPLAVVLMWLDLATRTDMRRGRKLVWAVFALIPLVPFLYVLTGGDLW
jgi:hypothetical protein